jgi:hypothetical protein
MSFFKKNSKKKFVAHIGMVRHTSFQENYVAHIDLVHQRSLKKSLVMRRRIQILVA